MSVALVHCDATATSADVGTIKNGHCQYIGVRVDIYAAETERAFVVLMKRHYLTPAGIPGEEASRYSDYSGMTDRNPDERTRIIRA